MPRLYLQYYFNTQVRPRSISYSLYSTSGGLALTCINPLALFHCIPTLPPAPCSVYLVIYYLFLAQRHFDYPVVEEQHPTGAGLLIHSKTLQSYLSLLGSSQKDDTLEACCGALQNLTAHPGIVRQAEQTHPHTN